MKMDQDREDRLSRFLKENRPEPPEPKPGEETGILAAVRSVEAEKRGFGSLPVRRWLVPAAVACAAVLAVVLTFVRHDPEPIVSVAGKNGDVESYLKETLGVVELSDDTVAVFPETGTRLIALAEAVSGENVRD